MQRKCGGYASRLITNCGFGRRAVVNVYTARWPYRKAQKARECLHVRYPIDAQLKLQVNKAGFPKFATDNRCSDDMQTHYNIQNSYGRLPTTPDTEKRRKLGEIIYMARNIS